MSTSKKVTPQNTTKGQAASSANTGDLYLWLHGLMAVVIDTSNFLILSPSAAMGHVYRFWKDDGQQYSADRSSGKL